MIVVLPVCGKEIAAAFRNLAWVRKLDGKLPFHCVLHHDSTIQNPHFLIDEARNTFETVSHHVYKDPRPGPWPGPQNAAFQSAALHVHLHHKEPWLWWEQDAVPVRKGWLSDIARAYQGSGKPFLGALSKEGGKPHLSGVAVYPANVANSHPDMMMTRNLPFDIVDAAKVLDKAAITPLIQHVWSFGTGDPPTFDSRSLLEKVAKETVLFHRCKDGTLIEQLSSKPKQPGLFRRMVTRKPVANKTCTYYHSGNLGDIIYALYAIKKAGGGELVIGPIQNETSPCSNPIQLDSFSMLSPLLSRQPYLTSFRFSEQYPGPGIIDLNRFRDQWNDWPLRNQFNIHTLIQMHCHTMGVAEKFCPTEPWLTAEASSSPYYIVHRSSRYRSADFPWPTIMQRFAGRLIFVGHRAEHADFQKDYGRLEFYPACSFLDMASLIAGAKGFIGNQSFPCSLALGVGQKVLQESWSPSPDCVFARPNFLTQPFGSAELERWERYG